MLGYDQEDISIMQECIETARKFYLSYPSDLMDKKRITTGLEQANSFFDGLWAEGYFD
jgi:hypothetical protein